MVLMAVVATGNAQEIGSLAAERARLREITGDSTLAPVTQRKTLKLSRSLLGTSFTPIMPSVRVVSNSAIPYSLNDGALWAGRGVSASLSGGFETERVVRSANVFLTIAPTLYYSQNKPFQVIANRTPGRSGWASPFYGPPASLDLPMRFGDRALAGFDFGNSAIRIEASRITAGATTAAAWWGPGIRNALILSNNAAGIPRLFVRTTQPVRSAWGAFDAEMISGALTKSRFFSESEVDFRSVSGVRVAWTPPFDSTLTLGFSRVVYSPIEIGESQTLATLARSFDAIVNWNNRIASVQESDQIGALFARWVFPQAGFEVYGEWARMDLPRAATELLTAAHYSGAWTFGFQWAQKKRAASYLRLQSELSYLEQSTVFPDRLTVDFYSGRASPQGFTQRGQVIGAAIGPGSSSQFIGLDWIASKWQAGGFVGRIRWNNDALYREPGVTFLHHDVSLLSGMRGGWRNRFSDVHAELTVAGRYNYLFQNQIVAPPGGTTVDISNITLALAVTPR
jgi:hypothetical protein